GWGAMVWTFVTHALIHSDLNHLILNALMLLAFGTPLARRFGALRFLLFLMATATAGVLFHLAAHLHDTSPVIGASGAISGAMAGAMRFVFQSGGPIALLGSRDEAVYRVPAASLAAMLRNPRLLLFLAVWFGINALFGMSSLSLAGIDQKI